MLFVEVIIVGLVVILVIIEQYSMKDNHKLNTQLLLTFFGPAVAILIYL